MKSLIKKILKKEGIRGEVNLVLVNDQEIQRLNNKFRKKDKPTDVLAFPMGEDRIIGDIAISTETAGRNARRFGVTYKQEMQRLVIHGVLHLVGYNHGRKMRSKEELYGSLLGKRGKRPSPPV